MPSCCFSFSICAPDISESDTRCLRKQTSEYLSYGTNLFVTNFYLNGRKRIKHTQHRTQRDHIVLPLNVTLDAYSLKYPSRTISATFEMPRNEATDSLGRIRDRCAHKKKKNVPLTQAKSTFKVG